MIRIHLLRHAKPGAPDRPTAEVPLSPAGLADAEAVVPLLGPLRIRRIVSSPYRRAVETVKPFAEQAGLEIELDAQLREREMPLASSPEDHFDQVRLSFEDIDYAQIGGESFRVTSSRATECLRRLAAETPAGLLLVGHGQCFTLILRSLDPRANFDFWKSLPTPAIIELTTDESAEQGSFRMLTSDDG